MYIYETNEINESLLIKVNNGVLLVTVNNNDKLYNIYN